MNSLDDLNVYLRSAGINNTLAKKTISVICLFKVSVITEFKACGSLSHGYKNDLNI
jgi:hypothetical protein